MNFSVKNTITKFILSLGFIAGFLSACNDDFTEEDSLNAQQTIDLSVYVIDLFDASALSGAEVSIVQDGAVVSTNTSEDGIVVFNDVKIGTSIPVSVSLEGYTEVQTLVSVDVDNFRQGQVVETISMLSLTQNVVTVRGTLEIETDLTNEETEVAPAGTVITAYIETYELGSINAVQFTAATDENGDFEMTLPATYAGIDYEFVYPTLTLDQTIAINGNEGDPDFPETLPTVETISIVFNPRGDSEDIPSVDPIYALASASPTGDDVIFGNVNIDEDSVISINVTDIGSGYNASEEFPITIVSLLGGSGADLIFTTDVDGEYLFQTLNDGGSGYPDFGDANQANQADPSFTFELTVRTGDTWVLESDYGTGTNRSIDVQ